MIPTDLDSFEESCLNEKRKENEEWATEVEEISEETLNRVPLGDIPEQTVHCS